MHFCKTLSWKSLWINAPAKCINVNVFEGTTLRAFSRLQTQYGIASNELFKYFQIRPFLTTHKKWDKIQNSLCNFEQYWIKAVENQNHTSKIISSLYNRIRLDLTDVTLNVRNKWELEANTIIQDEEW